MITIDNKSITIINSKQILARKALARKARLTWVTPKFICNLITNGEKRKTLHKYDNIKHKQPKQPSFFLKTPEQ